MSETTIPVSETLVVSPHTPSSEFERGARAAAESMRFYFLDENEGSIHADLSTETLEQHEAGAVADALADERRRIEQLTDPKIEGQKDLTRAALERILDERFPRVQPHTPRSSPRRGDDDAVDARDDERWAVSQFIDHVVEAGFQPPQQS